MKCVIKVTTVLGWEWNVLPKLPKVWVGYKIGIPIIPGYLSISSLYSVGYGMSYQKSPNRGVDKIPERASGKTLPNTRLDFSCGSYSPPIFSPLDFLGGFVSLFIF